MCIMFRFGGAYYPAHETPGRFGVVESGAILRRNVRCNGNEQSLWSCSAYSSAQTDIGCSHADDATVKCFPGKQLFKLTCRWMSILKVMKSNF
jgi:hypothetical protein